MKLEKNKIVFTSVIICILLFIGGYGIIVMGSEDLPEIDSNKIPIPELEDGQKEYHSKLEALDNLKEEREKTVPSLYPEHMIDDKGYFNPDYMELEKQRIIDSVYSKGRISYSKKRFRNLDIAEVPRKLQRDSVLKMDKKEVQDMEPELTTKELALEHQLFFASNPLKNENVVSQHTDPFIYVRVDGTQTVRNNYRLQMRLTKEAIINNIKVPKNTPIYGFVSFKPNRTIVEIENINHKPVKLKAFDLQDGSEGIYIENSFRGEARQEVVGDVVDDINIVGVPQVNGIKKIFQRNNRTIKVTITDNYQLILKHIK
ncbi:conjugative transposon protein TraM [Seonamhaeicola aphaedonensis]|uniref:Uncharacterized protein DUF3714 n=1 Tax=Seonamhaeicola aphaedonensis TaxID=1461338 RepID=A0A3D9H854_9FLAO|nr:conjugative transposon protein TraM [Seonamhaeicola aphaedonensis]RED45675.1 uncharacterized protein DUF3714 [Seonamhaeicola aphaedonensis]